MIKPVALKTSKKRVGDTIILGIDPGTAKMGCGIIKVSPKGAATLILADCLITPAEAPMAQRLKLLYTGLTELIKKYSPSLIVVEKLFFNTNAKTAMTVGQARGVVLLVAALHKLEIIEYTALEAKLVLTGYGRADKKEVQKAVKDYLKLSELIKKDDANDAVAMSLCYLIKNVIQPGKKT